MKKVSLNSSWLFLLIPIGFIYFIIVPEIQTKYNRFNEKQLAIQKEIRTLDSLQQATNLTSKGKHLLKRLEISVPIQKKVHEKNMFLYYKTGGMLLVLAFMFFGMIISGYLSNKKKKSPSNKVIDFHYDDFTTDAIGQSISWDPVENSGSNFASEKLKKTTKGYKITSSSYTKIFAWSFFLIGLNYVAISFYEYYKLSTIPLTFMKAGKMFFTSGGPFLIVGLILIFMFAPKVYILTRKRKVIAGSNSAVVLSYQELYALQILEKFIQGNSSGSYYSYEVNLVTKSGDRYNLLNHGDKTYILSDMVKISKILKIPVWNRNVV